MCGLAAYTSFMAQTDEIHRSVPACLNIKSRRLVERTVPKTRRLEEVSRGTPSPDLATNTQTLQACYSGGVREQQAKAKDILWKIKEALLFVCSDAVIFAISAVSCLTWWTHMLSCWGFWATDLVLHQGWRHHCTTTEQNKQLVFLAKLKPSDLEHPVAPVSL